MQAKAVKHLSNLVETLEAADASDIEEYLDDIIEAAANYRVAMTAEHGDVACYDNDIRYILYNEHGNLTAYSPNGGVCLFSERGLRAALVEGKYIKLGNLFRGYIPEPIEKEV